MMPWHLDAIGLQAARQNGWSATGKGITIAVVDTGLNTCTHPGLRGNVLSAYFVNADDPPTLIDHTIDHDMHRDGHGTNVAGLICGVAPDVQLISIALQLGESGESKLLKALELIAELIAREFVDVLIVNMSLGIRADNPAARRVRKRVRELVSQAEVLPIAAVGNRKRIKGALITQPRCPGNLREVISVGASTRDGQVHPDSLFGGGRCELGTYMVPNLVAPGAELFICVAADVRLHPGGTSFAAPIVSAIAAIILQHFPQLSMTQLREALLCSCKPLPGVPPERQGHGLAQVEPALRAAERISRTGGME